MHTIKINMVDEVDLIENLHVHKKQSIKWWLLWVACDTDLVVQEKILAAYPPGEEIKGRNGLLIQFRPQFKGNTK